MKEMIFHLALTTSHGKAKEYPKVLFTRRNSLGQANTQKFPTALDASSRLEANALSPQKLKKTVSAFATGLN